MIGSSPSNLIFICLGIAYPFLVYFMLPYLSPLFLLLTMLILLAARILIANSSVRKGRAVWLLTFVSAFTIAFGFVDPQLAVRAYPVAINLSIAGVFAYSLLFPPTIVERIARLSEPKLNDKGVRYTYFVTWIWTAFLFLNTAVSTATMLFASLEMWTLYNGFISYLCIGGLFAGEFVVRQFVKAGHKEPSSC
jgi:uncharacterized membrane protein